MTESRDTRTVVDFVCSALEATCDALMTLESIGKFAAPTRDEVTEGAVSEVHVAQAIAFLRHAIAELRLAGSRDMSPIALGFVARSARGRAEAVSRMATQAVGRKASQTRPRRTA